MKLKLILYTLLVFAVGFCAFLVKDMMKLKENLKREERRLRSQLAQIRGLQEDTYRFKETLKRLQLKEIGREEAMRTVLGEVEFLRRSYEVHIVRNLKEKEGTMIMVLRIDMKPSQVPRLLERAFETKSPVYQIQSLTVDRTRRTRAVMTVTLLQPFLEGKR